jgi:hypothetical protein
MGRANEPSLVGWDKADEERLAAGWARGATLRLTLQDRERGCGECERSHGQGGGLGLLAGKATSLLNHRRAYRAPQPVNEVMHVRPHGDESDD